MRLSACAMDCSSLEFKPAVLLTVYSLNAHFQLRAVMSLSLENSKKAISLDNAFVFKENLMYCKERGIKKCLVHDIYKK